MTFARLSPVPLAAFLLCACLQPVEPFVPRDQDDGGASGADAGTDGGTDGGSFCTSDSQCPQGAVCEGCTPETRSCIQGCRQHQQCGAEEMCRPVQCYECPCPQGQCVAESCVDKDGDGYVKSCDRRLCPGKQGNCDCDDSDFSVHHGVKEICGNGKDDDCSGKIDAADPSCQMCLASRLCTSNWDCKLGEESCSLHSVQGCCQMCPVFDAPLCKVGDCAYAQGINPTTGCQNSPLCASCCTCPGLPPKPVCGANGGTYSSECEAGCARALVVHEGACAPGEGMSCTPTGAQPCGSSGTMYCRDACPTCADGMYRCTQIGACITPLDCPAGAPPPNTCPNGKPPTPDCLDRKCQYSCPP